MQFRATELRMETLDKCKQTPIKAKQSNFQQNSKKVSFAMLEKKFIFIYKLELFIFRTPCNISDFTPSYSLSVCENISSEI